MSPAEGAALRTILSRRSVGRVLDEPIPRPVVEELIEAAIRAPNHGLTHPWRFIVLQGDARRAAGEAHLAARERLGPPIEDATREKEASRFERAPVVIVCVCRSPSDEATVRIEDRDAVAAGVQNLLLAAADHGLGAIWRTGVMTDEEELREHLGLDAEDDLVGFVYVGKPAAQAKGEQTRRPAVAEVTEWRGLSA
ncbi:MAG: nitroreductase family protein [Miltoncostaeaceae bacterium]